MVNLVQDTILINNLYKTSLDQSSLKKKQILHTIDQRFLDTHTLDNECHFFHLLYHYDYLFRLSKMKSLLVFAISCPKRFSLSTIRLHRVDLSLLSFVPMETSMELH